MKLATPGALTAEELRAVGVFAPSGTTGRYTDAGARLEVTYPGHEAVVLVRSNDSDGHATWERVG